ncbi:MAG: ABC transporter permease [Chloroflexota bacterium]|nr:ABC transporter permease [Chloroflexota bacterium]
MTAYIVRRLLWMVPILLGVSVITFAMLKNVPGDPVSQMMATGRSGGARATQADRERLARQYGLDKPVYIQYVDWLREIARGNLGTSFESNRPVLELILERLPNTMKLAGMSLVLTLVIALPLGIISAVKQNTATDYALTFLSFVGISIPSFWLALMILYFFGVELHWFPTRGMRSIMVEPGFWNGLKDSAQHYVLPVFAVTLIGLSGYVRFQRAAMLEVIGQDYIRTARAKGVPERSVILKHAWRNALLPIITLLGYVLVVLVEGSIVVETIFTWPGMGLLAVDALSNKDYPLVMGVVLLSSVMILLGTLLSDILYAVVDPRVRYD